MIWIVNEIIASGFSVFVIVSFFRLRLQRRAPLFLLWGVSALYTIALFLLQQVNYHIGFNVIISVALCSAVSLLYRASWKQRALYPLIIVLLGMIAEMASALIYSGIFEMSASRISELPQGIYYLIANVTSKLLFFVAIRIICRLQIENDSTLPHRYWLIIMLVPVISILVGLGVAASSEDFIVKNPVVPLLTLIGLLAINALTFAIYDILSSLSVKLVEHERARSRMEADRHHYNVLISQSQDLAAILHDTRKHYDVISGLLAADDSVSAQSYVDKLRREKTSDTISSSPNAAIETVLRMKISEAHQYGIRVDLGFHVLESLPIDEIALCMILGNALDNAIEACRKLDSGAEETIEVDIRYENHRLLIRIANPSLPVDIINNRCSTSKMNKHMHGYGLLNIQKAVSENGGNSVIRYDNGRFILSIVFLFGT